MADSSPLAGPLDRAGNVFSLAGKLGRAFHEEHQGQGRQIDPAGWNRHAPAFDEFCTALLELRDAMQNPPDGFSPVAKPLLEGARVAKGIRDAMQRADGRYSAAYLDFFPELNSVCESGLRVVKEVTKARRLDDPLAFADEPGLQSDSPRDDPAPIGGTSWDALCRDFPATFGGQVGNGFYREKWIAWFRDQLKLFGRPPSLQQAYRWARPPELAARLLAYGLATEAVRDCVYRPDENRDFIYAILSRGNGQPVESLLHLFAPTTPTAGASLLADVRAQAEKLCKELNDTTPAPEPNSICPAVCLADQFVKWPEPEQIESALSEPPEPAFTFPDRFPLTPAGHLAFIEWVRDEIHHAAEGKRNQFDRNYSNDTLESMVRGRPERCAEARRLLATLTDIPTGVRGEVDAVLARELTIGTVERFDELLGPVVRRLRDAWEDSRAVVGMAELLDTALADEHAEQNERTRQFWVEQCGMPSKLTYEQGMVWARERQSESDAADKAWRDKVSAFERLIENRCRARMLAAGFRDVELQGAYVPCLPGYVDRNDPRMPAFKEAMRKLRLDEQAKARALGCAPAAIESAATREESGDGGFIGRLLAGPEDAELTARELALLEAHLKQRVSLAQMQREAKADGKSETSMRRNKLKLIRDFNRNLQAVDAVSIERKPTDSETSQTKAEAGKVLANGPESNDPAKRGDVLGRDAKLNALKPAERKAYFSFAFVESKAGRRLEDREAYDQLKEHGLPNDAGDLGELTDYALPAFDTWTRQLRAARNALGEQKYTPRSNRPRGGSIVSANQLD